MVRVLKLATPHQVKRAKRNKQLLLCEAPKRVIVRLSVRFFRPRFLYQSPVQFPDFLFVYVSHFLAADSRLDKRLCPSIHYSVFSVLDIDTSKQCNCLIFCLFLCHFILQAWSKKRLNYQSFLSSASIQLFDIQASRSHSFFLLFQNSIQFLLSFRSVEKRGNYKVDMETNIFKLQCRVNIFLKISSF